GRTRSSSAYPFRCRPPISPQPRRMRSMGSMSECGPAGAAERFQAEPGRGPGIIIGAIEDLGAHLGGDTAGVAGPLPLPEVSRVVKTAFAGEQELNLAVPHPAILDVRVEGVGRQGADRLRSRVSCHGEVADVEVDPERWGPEPIHNLDHALRPVEQSVDVRLQ